MPVTALTAPGGSSLSWNKAASSGSPGPFDAAGVARSATAAAVTLALATGRQVAHHLGTQPLAAGYPGGFPQMMAALQGGPREDRPGHALAAGPGSRVRGPGVPGSSG